MGKLITYQKYGCESSSDSGEATYRKFESNLRNEKIFLLSEEIFIDLNEGI